MATFQPTAVNFAKEPEAPFDCGTVTFKDELTLRITYHRIIFMRLATGGTEVVYVEFDGKKKTSLEWTQVPNEDSITIELKVKKNCKFLIRYKAVWLGKPDPNNTHAVTGYAFPTIQLTTDNGSTMPVIPERFFTSGMAFRRSDIRVIGTFKKV